MREKIPSLLSNRLLTLLLVVLFGFQVKGQTKVEKQEITKVYNKAKLVDLQRKAQQKYTEKREAAYKYALANNIPTVYTTKEGNLAVLQSITSDGHLLYYETENAGAALTTRANTLNTGGRLGLDLNGQGMTIGIWDGGAINQSHEAFQGDRVVQVDGATTCSDHANHVAGTMMAGFGVGPNGDAQGMAYEANLVAHDLNNDLAEATPQAMDGLLLSNHSYGFPASGVPLHFLGKYVQDSKDWDELMYEAPYYQVVLSAGNSREPGPNVNGKGGYDLLTAMKTSKNSIVVAAVNEVANYTGPASVVMSNFSSWGPTDDGRIKPDLSAKGVNVLSSVCNGGYGVFNGTSMAAPNTTGTLTLLQQHYNNVNGEFMYASQLRGLAIHTADEAGDFDGPDYRFGWGLLNAERAAQVISQHGETTLFDSHVLEDGDSYVTAVSLDGSTPLEVTICWTDPAGNIVTSTAVDFFETALVNDLDVRITKDGETFYPWKLDPGDPSAPATKGDNVVDNVEKVAIPNPVAGDYVITVTHKNSLVNGSQRFAIILTGAQSFEPILINTFDYQQDAAACPTSGIEVAFTSNAKVGFAGDNDEITSHYWIFEGGNPATSTSENPIVSYLGAGPYDVTLIVESTIGNDTLIVENLIKTSDLLPYAESFDQNIPEDWEKHNGWLYTNTGTNEEAGAIWVNNFDNDYGAIDIISNFLNANEWDSLTINFDVAYTYFSSAVTDSLRISIADCNGENTVWQKGGFQLATTSPKTTLFSPTSSQWRTETLKVSVENIDHAKIVFTNLGGNGNALYIDNISVEGFSPALNIELGDDVTVCNSTTLDPGFAGADSYSWTKAGDATVLGTSQTLTVTESGTYQVEVTAFGETKTDQVTVTVNFPSTASFTYSTSNDFLTVNFTNSSTNAESYEWNFGDGSAISTEEAPTHVYADYGSYTVTLTTKAACGDDTQSTLLTEVTALDVDNYLSSRMLVYPNPNEGSFVLDVKNINFQQATIQVLDITGRRIFSEEVKSLSNHNINLRNIEAGIYFIRLDVDGKTGIQKVQIR